jgi:hypothetical protein
VNSCSRPNQISSSSFPSKAFAAVIAWWDVMSCLVSYVMRVADEYQPFISEEHVSQPLMCTNTVHSMHRHINSPIALVFVGKASPAGV